MNNKYIISLLVSFFALLSNTAFAMPQEHTVYVSGFYANDNGDDEHVKFMKANFGLRLPPEFGFSFDLNPYTNVRFWGETYMALELGATKIEYEDKVNPTKDREFETLHIALKPYQVIGPVQIYTHVGYYSGDVEYAIPSSEYEEKDSGLMLGVGLDLFVHPRLSIGVGYDYYMLSSDMDGKGLLGVNLGYHFL